MSTLPPSSPGKVETFIPQAETSHGKNPRRFALLDLLRAIAVLVVIVYHVFPSSVPAGFLGVDLFFVLSGYLITSGLLARIPMPGHKGGISRYLVEFYRKRVRRLFPAFAFMLVIVCTLSLFAPEDVRVRLGRQILGAVTSTANWVQLATGSSYFDAGTPQLLKHMWSLAVEEQFYLIWPALIIAAAWAAKRRYLATSQRSPQLAEQQFREKLRARLAIFTAFAAIVSGISMALVFVKTGDPNQAYLNSLTHASGLLLGAFVACLPKFSGIGRFMRPLLGLTATLLALLCFVVLSDTNPTTQLGGIFAFSVAISVLVRLGVTPPTSRLNAQAPAFAPIRWVADRSYAMYLWHWPLLVLFIAWMPDRNGGEVEPSLLWARAAATILGTFILSEISYRLVEAPVLRQGFRASLSGLKEKGLGARVALPALSLALVAGTVFAGVSAPTISTQQKQLEALQKDVASPPQPGAPQGPPVSGGAESKGVDSKEVTFIGDSVTVAASRTIAKNYPYSPIQAKVGEQMWTAQNTVADLKSQGKLGKTVVIALGTNGDFTWENLEEVIQAAGADRRFVLVTGYGSAPWIEQANQKLRAYAEKNPRRARLADWAENAKQAKDMAPDGVHPGPQGAKIWIDGVTNAIKSF